MKNDQLMGMRVRDVKHLVINVCLSCIAITACVVGAVAYLYADSMKTQYDKDIVGITSMYEQKVGELETKNQSLCDSLQGMTTNYDNLQQRLNNDKAIDVAMIKKYMYVIDSVTPDSGITLDVIQYMDEVCKEKNINPHLMWAIIELESKYKTRADNANSSARGLGQVLESTARSYWVGIMGNPSYDHTMAYDPYVNIAIITTMVSRNAGSGIQNTLDLYSGGASWYLSEIRNIMTNNGQTFKSITYQ